MKHIFLAITALALSGTFANAAYVSAGPAWFMPDIGTTMTGELGFGEQAPDGVLGFASAIGYKFPKSGFSTELEITHFSTVETFEDDGTLSNVEADRLDNSRLFNFKINTNDGYHLHLEEQFRVTTIFVNGHYRFHEVEDLWSALIGFGLGYGSIEHSIQIRGDIGANVGDRKRDDTAGVPAAQLIFGGTFTLMDNLEAFAHYRFMAWGTAELEYAGEKFEVGDMFSHTFDGGVTYHF